VLSGKSMDIEGSGGIFGGTLEFKVRVRVGGVGGNRMSDIFVPQILSAHQ
jgi:hypothetical protein